MPTNTIGTYNFASMQGEIPHPQSRIERLVRDGVDYARYRFTGYGSEPFVVTTRVNVASIAEGRTVFGGYTGLVGAGAVAFVKADYDLPTTESKLVHVLGVEIVRLAAVNVWCGSLDDSDKFELSAQWRLEIKA